MPQFQRQKWPLTTFFEVSFGAVTIFLSRYKLGTCVLPGDTEGLDNEMLCAWANLSPNTENVPFYPSLHPRSSCTLQIAFIFCVQVEEFKGNTHIRHHCDKCVCYKKRQRLRGSILKTILHEGKAIFSTKQTNITKQVQWYFYILEIVQKQEKNQG